MLDLGARAGDPFFQTTHQGLVPDQLAFEVQQRYDVFRDLDIRLLRIPADLVLEQFQTDMQLAPAAIDRLGVRRIHLEQAPDRNLEQVARHRTMVRDLAYQID
jgi:hypothetical protein